MVLDQVPRVLNALMDIAAVHQKGAAVISLIKLHQMIIQVFDYF